MTRAPSRFHIALLPMLTGALWLWFGARHSPWAFLVCLFPGLLILATGTGLFLWPSERRHSHVMAFASVVGALLFVPCIFLIGIQAASVLLVLTIVCFFVAGSTSMRVENRPEGVPELAHSITLSGLVGIDDAMLGLLVFITHWPNDQDVATIRSEAEQAKELFEDQGWLKDPAAYHLTPPPLVDPILQPGKALGMPYEHLSFDSGYEPHPDEPGRQRWLSYDRNRTAHAWVLRHPGAPRPWLMCIHGYQMGFPVADLYGFDAKHYFEKLGLNLIFPVLPLHGLRKKGWMSGDGYFSGILLDSIHAEAQAMWDLRRMLSWVRAQSAPAVGVYGLSLGGYNTSLLASLDDQLACAIPGVPATDFTKLFWHHGPSITIRYMEEKVAHREDLAVITRVISPLALEPKVPLEHRFIFAGAADQQVPPDHVRDLWLHWGQPRIHWYQGCHVSFRLDPLVTQGIERTLHKAGVWMG